MQKSIWSSPENCSRESQTCSTATGRPSASRNRRRLNIGDPTSTRRRKATSAEARVVSALKMRDVGCKPSARISAVNPQRCVISFSTFG